MSLAPEEAPMVTAEFNPLAPGVLADPYPMYRALLKHNPVSWSEMMEMWILTRYADVDFVLTHPAMSADRANARNRFAEMQRVQQASFGPFNRAPSMLNSDPPVHTRLRRLVSKAFTPRAVEKLRPRIQEIVDGLLDEVEADGQMDLVTTLGHPVPVIVIAELLGVPVEDRAKFKKWSDDVVATLGGPFVPPNVLEEARLSIEALAEYLIPIIHDRRTHPREDLISALVAAKDEGQELSEDEIFTTTILLLVAGNETTTHLIDNGTYALLRNPDQLQRLRDDPSLIVSATEELLRFIGPVQATGRVLKEDMVVAGQDMKAGQVAFTLLGAANHDPAKWGDNADELDITRNAADHVGLGDGIHFCLGAPLARAEAQITIGSLVRRFPNLRLENDSPEWGGTFIIRGVKSLPLSW
jgi:pimeloyl-[acyl-carrier protein] synthase